eukprot:ANDGO_07548.mRNA.1 Cytosolic carboxypeptidase 6
MSSSSSARKAVRQPPKPKKGEIIFDSNYESGNLGNVNRTSDFEYELYIRPDTNNPKHRLWFNFKVSNVRAGQRAIFSVVNFSKTRSLYRLGMAPVVRSTSRPNWVRMHEKQAFYYRSPRNKKQYVLSFIFLFDNENDEYQFAYSFPYTYMYLQKFLYSIERLQLPFFSRTVLCKTILGRNMDVVAISNPDNMLPDRKPRIIFITGRVHPGETPSSYICHGLINFLLSNDSRAELLRNNFLWMIAPMLNPDGVFLGNYRSSSLGHDLNRFWLSGDEWSHPTLHHVRELLVSLDRDPRQDLQFFIDIHAHSTGTNCFMYVNTADTESQREKNMMFPRLFSLNSRDFSASTSRFCKDPSKAGTGRRAIGDFLSVDAHCYTLEVSFFCSLGARGKPFPFSQQSYLNLGRDLAISFLDYYRIPHFRT